MYKNAFFRRTDNRFSEVKDRGVGLIISKYRLEFLTDMQKRKKKKKKKGSMYVIRSSIKTRKQL